MYSLGEKLKVIDLAEKTNMEIMWNFIIYFT